MTAVSAARAADVEHRALATGERRVEQDDGAERLAAGAHLDLGDDARGHLHRAAFEALADVALDRGQAGARPGAAVAMFSAVRERRIADRAGELLGGLVPRLGRHRLRASTASIMPRWIWRRVATCVDAGCARGSTSTDKGTPIA